MNTVSSDILVAAPLHVVRQILLEPTALADWNPAFLEVRGPAAALVGTRYPLTAKGGLRGHWEYLAIGERDIEGSFEVPGLAETNSWHLRPQGAGTLVAHSFTNRGALATLLRPAFANVADLRLDRLADRARRRVPAKAS